MACFVYSRAEGNVWTFRPYAESERLKPPSGAENQPMPSGALLNFSLNFLSALVALLTSYYAYRFNRMMENPVLRAISLGFMMLGVGLVVDAGTSLFTGRLLVESYAERVLVLLATFTYLTLQMVAYLVIALGYSRAAYGGSKMEATLPAALVGTAAVTLYGYSVLSYLVSVVLLGIVLFQGFLLRSGGKSRFSNIVFLAFGLILTAHLVLLLAVLSLGAGLFLIGTGVQFVGFLSLLAFVVRSEVIGPG